MDANPELSGSEKIDVKKVLQAAGWECGPEFEQRYYTDSWVFNLVNLIERLAQDREDVQAKLLEAYWDGEMDVSRFAHRVLKVLDPEKFQ